MLRTHDLDPRRSRSQFRGLRRPNALRRSRPFLSALKHERSVYIYIYIIYIIIYMAVYALLVCMKRGGSEPASPDLWAPAGAWRTRSYLRRHPLGDVTGQSGSAWDHRFGVQPTHWETRRMQARGVYKGHRAKWGRAFIIVKIWYF